MKDGYTVHRGMENKNMHTKTENQKERERIKIKQALISYTPVIWQHGICM